MSRPAQGLRYLATLIALVLVAGVPVAGARADDGEDLVVEGSFFVPQMHPQDRNAKPIFMDVEGRRLFVQHGVSEKWLAEYDLNKNPPQLIRDMPVNFIFGSFAPTPATMSIDSARRKVFVLEFLASGPGETECPKCAVIRSLDLKTLKFDQDYFNLSRQLPNYWAEGMTYSPVDHRIYTVGTLVGHPAYIFNALPVPPPAYPVTMAAWDADDGSLLWHRTLTQCERTAFAEGVGAPLFRSTASASLYTPCVRADSQVVGSYPGQSGIIRLHIDPSAVDSSVTGTSAVDSFVTGTSTWETDFFPISGTYTSGSGISGLTAFDPVSDRVFFTSQSAGSPGTWVLDGRISAWVGFVPGVKVNTDGLAVDPGTGRFFFKAGDGRQLVSSDGRLTPVPQGERSDLPQVSSTGRTLWPFDPQTRRLFARGQDPNSVVIVRDSRKPRGIPPPVNRDAMTDDVAEGADTVSGWTGIASGWGSRATLVGGWGGVREPIGHLNCLGVCAPRELMEIEGVSPGDRGVIAGSVPMLDLTDTSARAGARAIQPDTLTDDDYRTKQNELLITAGFEQAQLDDAVRPLTNWPWSPQTCFDGGGMSAAPEESARLGEARVACDLESGKASAFSEAGRVSLDVAELSINRSTFSSRAFRDPVRGIVTETTATARGVDLVVPQYGRLTIGRVTAVATTSAHGRSGSARATWESLVGDVTLTDASGKTVWRCGESCDPAQVANAVNGQLGIKVRVRLPKPRMTQTRKGVFSSVAESDTDFYNGLITNNDDSRAVPALQILVLNDYGEKSRVDVQLAAIQASSTYWVKRPKTPRVSPPPGESPSPEATVKGTYFTDPGDYATPPGDRGSVPVRVLRSVLLLVRSPRDAVLVSLLFSLFGAAGASIWRRRQLAQLLERG